MSLCINTSPRGRDDDQVRDYIKAEIEVMDENVEAAGGDWFADPTGLTAMCRALNKSE